MSVLRETLNNRSVEGVIEPIILPERQTMGQKTCSDL
ncbi:MAG: hypothetical protein M2R46_02526 [Verrucomicrobia subdivision 3 bacterium]|nr:hypothetical protein [Limisphaerales bacterium]